MEVRVVNGNIASIEADALITAINSGRAWFGGIDGVIQRVAGDMFHSQVARSNLVDGSAIAVKASRPHSGGFKDVVFVVDDLRHPLHDIVVAGLKAADETGYKFVTIPTIRMGVMLGVVEKSAEEAIDEIAYGIRIAMQYLKNLECVTIVVYSNQNIEELLKTRLTV